MGGSGDNYTPAFASNHVAVSACPQKVELCGKDKIIHTNYAPFATDEEQAEGGLSKYMIMEGQLTR